MDASYYQLLYHRGRIRSTIEAIHARFHETLPAAQAEDRQEGSHRHELALREAYDEALNRMIDEAKAQVLMAEQNSALP